MYYEQRYGGRRKTNRRRRGGCLARLFKIALALVVCWALVTLALTGYVRFVAPSDGWVHVLLVGVDGESDNGRTDAMILASVGSDGRLKLTSLLRDTMVDMGQYGKHKLNAAYKLGGGALLMRCVEQCFGVNVSRIATINLSGFPQVVDSLGGVYMDVTEAEMARVNKGMRARRWSIQDFSPLTEMTRYGKNMLLTGEQALAYARIRHIDSDYVRTQRQRRLLSAILQRVRTTRNPLTWAAFAKTAFSCTTTSMSAAEVSMLGLRVVLAGAQTSMYRLPADGTFESGTKDGVWSIRADFEKNKALFREYLAE